MRKEKMKHVLGFLLVSTLVLGACGGGTDEADNSTDSSQVKEQVFRNTVDQEMPSADLSLATDTISFSALNNVYEGLYRLDKDSQPEPAGAAEMAEISDDGLTYTFKLREDAKWSNGDPLVASDYVYAWQRTVAPETGGEYAYLFELVKNGAAITNGDMAPTELGVKAVSDYELEITLEQITPYFDYLLAFPSFFPQNQKVVEEFGKDYASTSDKSVYNGPFTLTDFDGPGVDTEWSYTKNDTYWDKDTVKLDKINVTVVKEATTGLNLFQDGQADDVTLSGELAQQMASDPELVIVKEARTSYIELNQRTPESPYNNENLRKAISYAIDREALVNQILGDGSVVATGLVPSEMSFSPTDKEDFAKESGNHVEYSPEKAKEHWEKAKSELGITTLKMNILVDDQDSMKKVIEYVQGALNETLEGMEVTMSPVPFSVRLDRSSSGDFDIVMSGWGADYADPSSFTDLFVTGNAYNRGRYSNEEYDKLVKAAGTTDAADPEKRWQDMLDTEKIIMDDMGVIPVYQKATAHLRSAEVKGVVAHGAGATYDYKWTYIE